MKKLLLIILSIVWAVPILANQSVPAATNAYSLYLTNNIASACTFNRTSGAKVEADSWVTITAIKSSAYEFLGWYKGGEKISNTLSFNYQMPHENTTLEARFKYNPQNPGDPNSQNGGDVAQTKVGDANNDGKINVSDFSAIAGYIMGTPPATFVEKAADVNADNKINVSDLTGVATIILYGSLNRASSVKSAK